MTGGPHDDPDEIKALLTERLEDVAEQVMGPPSPETRRKKDWKWPASGGAHLVVRGHKRGAFYCFSSGAGGGPLDLIMHGRSCSFAAAVEWAKAWLDMSGGAAAAPADGTVHQERARKRAAAEAEEARDRNRRIAGARRIAAECVPTDGTVGDRYLTVTRRITKPSGGWPSAVRFHPGQNALAVLATDDAGNVQAVQLVYLTPEARKISKEEARRRRLPGPKQTFGVLDGAAVRLPSFAVARDYDGDGPEAVAKRDLLVDALLLAEGPETGLSAWTATGCETWVALGSMAKLNPPAARQLILCADDDKRDAPAAKALGKTIWRWRDEGYKVAVATPWVTRRFDKSDFNDLLRADGAEAVQARIAAALPPGPEIPPDPPGAPRPLLSFHPLPQHSAAEARTETKRQVRGFLARAQAWHATPIDVRGAPEHAGLAVEVGTGKTSITCGELAPDAAELAAGFIAEMKAAGLPHRVQFTVPTHKLGGEVNTRLAGLGVHVATFRGREAEDPETGTAMCHDLPAVQDAIAAYQDVEASVCGKPGGSRCPFAQRCGYQMQKAAAAAADVVVAAHETMLGGLPAGIGNGFALTIADEGWLQDGAEKGRTLTTETLRAGEHDHPIMFEGDPTRRDNEATFDLHALRRRLADALDASPGGYLTRAALVATGLTAEGCGKANKLEWRRKVQGVMHPGMAAEARQDAVRRCAGNAAIPRLSALWKAAGALLDGDEEATGRVELGRRDNAEGSQRVVLLNTLRPVADRVLALPLLLLDATLPTDLLRHRLPRLTVLAEIRAAAPHMRVHQILGGFGKTSIIPDPDPQKRENSDKRKKENQRRLNLIADVRDFILLCTGGARTLVVTYKELEPHFADLPGVETAHFNAIEGRDEWGPQPDRPGIRYLFQIGRPMASPEETRRAAAALTGRPVPKEDAGLVTRGATMRDGSAAPVQVRAYGDPDLEAVRASITDAATVQVIGRGRGLNRTAANPLDVFLLAGDVLAPLPLDTLTTWRDAAPGPSARMAARGVVLTSPSDAARAYPDLFPKGEKAAREALAREAKEAGRQQGYFRPIPLWKTFIGEWVGNTDAWTTVRYRPAGRGQQTRIARARSDRLPNLRPWLIAATNADLQLYEPSSTAAELPDTRAASVVPLSPEAPAPLPRPASPLHAASRAPSPAEIMLALEGVALDNATDAALAFPQRWPSAEAFRKARSRAKRQLSAAGGAIAPQCPEPRTIATISYQRRGAGMWPASGTVELTRVPDPGAWLEKRFGPLAWFSMDPPLVAPPARAPEAPCPASPLDVLHPLRPGAGPDCVLMESDLMESEDDEFLVRLDGSLFDCEPHDPDLLPPVRGLDRRCPQPSGRSV
jgi:hypothetical protein